MDEFTEYSPGSRAVGCFAPVIGVFLLIISVWMLFSNEGRALERAKTIKDCKRVCVTLPPSPVSQANNWKLVHITGKAATPEMHSDTLFGVSANAIKLRREADMYQWDEECEENGDFKTYRYYKVWSERPINSAAFKKPQGHGNPSQMPIQDAEVQSSNVTLGAFTLSPELIAMISDYKPLALPKNALSKVSPDIRSQMQIHDNEFYWGPNPEKPQIGDERIRYVAILPETMTVVAMQQNNTLVAYKTYSGQTFQMIKPGTVPQASMFTMADKENRILTWIVRFFGFILCASGVIACISPLLSLTSWIPILGDVVGFTAAYIAAGLGAVISLITVAVAWLYYRPEIAAFMMVAAVGLLTYLGCYLQQKKAVHKRSLRTS